MTRQPIRRWLLTLVGALIGFTVVGVSAQGPFNSQIQIAINQLTTGVIPFTALRNAANAYINFGATGGVNGYGFRDNSGTIQFKQSGGSWVSLPASGTFPTGAPYITRTADPDLSNEFALGTLATALLVNTITTGIPTAYAGTTCTNQFQRALNADGSATCASVALATDTTGTLGVANGGTGLTSGTSGGVLGYTATGTLASSGALTASALLLGGGAGAVPTALGTLGTTTTLLHGNAAGAPTFGAAVLTTDVSGILPSANGGTANAFFTVSGPATATKTFTFPNASSTVLTDNADVTPAQGGTGLGSYTTGDLIQASGATTLAALVATSTGNALISGGVGTISAWGKIGLTTHISGTLAATNGGTGLSAYTTGDLIFASSATTLAVRNAVAVGSVLISNGVGAAPVYSANPRISTLLLGANLALSSAAPTISSGFGTGPSVTSGTSAAFRVDVGTGGAASAGVVALPTATTGWNCAVENLTATTANVADARTVQLSSTTATATFENQTISTGMPLVWTASDVLGINCVAF